jgi:hypothetical protein
MNNNTTPKRFTAINDVTGALIKSGSDNQDAYSKNWEAIWGKKTLDDKKAVQDEPDTPTMMTFPVALMEDLYKDLEKYAHKHALPINTVVSESIRKHIYK